MKRNLQIEYLRVLSMLMIVFHHYFIYGVAERLSQDIWFYDLAEFLGSFGKMGVILFVLISGYFAKPGPLKWKKLLELNNTARLYMAFGLLITLMTGGGGLAQAPFSDGN